MRRDFVHKAGTSIARRYGVSDLEALKTKTMAASAKGAVGAPGAKVRQNAGLNRPNLLVARRASESARAYKLEA